MDENIQTERLTLRAPIAADAEAITAAVRDPRIYRNVGRIKPNQTTLETTHEVIAGWAPAREAKTNFVYAIMSEDDQLAGIIGGNPNEIGAFEIGYWIAPNYWGRGYATESGAALLKAARQSLGVRVFTAGYIEDNPSSGHVLRKLGFIPCGRSRYFVFGRQETCWSLDMALVF